jgi:DNA-binding CsgD family transcriptional regulator
MRPVDASASDGVPVLTWVLPRVSVRALADRRVDREHKQSASFDVTYVRSLPFRHATMASAEGPMSNRSSLGAASQIRAGLATLRRRSGLPLTFGGTVSERDQKLTLTEFAAQINGPLRGSVLDRGRGLGGKAVATGRPQVVVDYLATSRISHDYDRIILAENLRAMVAMPVVVNRMVRGIMYGAIHEAIPLGDRIVIAVSDAAREVGQRIAVDDEVSRRLSQAESYVSHPPVAGGSAASQWEEVREAFASLRVLAAGVSDPDLRARITSISEGLAAAVAGEGKSVRPLVPLSAREVDVLACVAMGLTNAELGRHLNVRAETVKSYLRSAMRKLGCHSRLEAVVAARRVGALP